MSLFTLFCETMTGSIELQNVYC